MTEIVTEDTTVKFPGCTRRRNRFGRRREDSLMASHAAYGKDLAVHSHYLLTLHDLSDNLHQTTDVNELLWKVARTITSELNLEDCVIYLLNEDREYLQQRAAYGPKASVINTVVKPKEIPLGVGIVGAVAASGKPEIVNDTVCDNRYVVDDKARLSELTVPLLYQSGQVMGVIDSEHSTRGFFTFDHLRIIELIAHMVAEKIEIQLLKQQLTAMNNAPA